MHTDLTKQMKIYLSPEADLILAINKSLAGRSMSRTVNDLVLKYVDLENTAILAKRER